MRITRTSKRSQQVPPSLQQLGSEIRARLRAESEAEAANRRASAPRPRRWRRRVSVAALLAGAAALVALLDTGGAGALDIINRAPEAAAKSETVRFRSTIAIQKGTELLASFIQHGEIDFASRAYSTTLQFSGEAIEQRRVADVFYAVQIPRGAASRPVRWLAIPVAREPASQFASSAESEEFTSPLVLLAELGGTRAPVTDEGPEILRVAQEGGEQEGRVLTTRYHLETNLAALLRAAPRASVPPAGSRNVSASLTVWLDRQGGPRKVAETLRGPSRAPASIRIVTSFGGYGEQVAVEPPHPIARRSKRSIHAPNPLAAAPVRLFEQMFKSES